MTTPLEEAINGVETLRCITSVSGSGGISMTTVTALCRANVVRPAQRRGAKVVVIDPTWSRTKAADWYITIQPGTDAA